MSTSNRKDEISVWINGDEGRFLDWQDSEWYVFEYYNYRHHFEETTLAGLDYGALRKHFGLQETEPTDMQLAKMSPDKLREIGQSNN